MKCVLPLEYSYLEPVFGVSCFNFLYMKTSRPSLNTHNSELRVCTQPLVGDISDYTNPDVQVNDDVFFKIFTQVTNMAI